MAGGGATTMDVYLITLSVSAPCRAVLMAAKCLGLTLNQKMVDFTKGEHLQQRFLEINPQHCVPTLDDDGFILWESRAIMTYLVNQYAPSSPLYPQDPAGRALVDRMLNFDIGVLYPAILNFFRPQILYGQPADSERKEAFEKAVVIFEHVLKETPYAAGEHLTLADVSIYAGLCYTELKDYSYEAYPMISAWLQKLKGEVPGNREINEEPNEQFKELLNKGFVYKKEY